MTVSSCPENRHITVDVLAFSHPLLPVCKMLRGKTCLVRLRGGHRRGLPTSHTTLLMQSGTQALVPHWYSWSSFTASKPGQVTGSPGKERQAQSSSSPWLSAGDMVKKSGDLSQCPWWNLCSPAGLSGEGKIDLLSLWWPTLGRMVVNWERLESCQESEQLNSNFLKWNSSLATPAALHSVGQDIRRWPCHSWIPRQQLQSVLSLRALSHLFQG